MEFIIGSLVLLYSVLFGSSFYPSSEDASTPSVLTIMFMLWNVLINSEDLSNKKSSSTCMNATLLLWLLNAVKSSLRIPRVRCLILDENSKGCELAEHVATKFEVDPQMLSTLKTQNMFEAWNQVRFWDINGWNSENFSCLGQEKNRGVLFQFR